MRRTARRPPRFAAVAPQLDRLVVAQTAGSIHQHARSGGRPTRPGVLRRGARARRSSGRVFVATPAPTVSHTRVERAVHGPERSEPDVTSGVDFRPPTPSRMHDVATAGRSVHSRVVSSTAVREEPEMLV